jgi:CBS domain-containing protein
MKTKNATHPDESGARKLEPKHDGPGGEFVGRMFSGFGHTTVLGTTHAERPWQEPYRSLQQLKAGPGATYRLQSQTTELQVQATSPATNVMTDLTRVAAITIDSNANVDEAQKAMIARGVRALFVVDEARAVLGIITSNDVLGEKPVEVAQERGVRHVDVLVRDVMTSADSLEALEFRDVLKARVGDIVETLKHSGRQHALVIESGPGHAASATHTVRGLFSLTQIARQLGLPIQIAYDVARTFAEIEAAIGG